jgi:hypothetical protein
MGILAMPGRQCCDKSEQPPDGGPLPVDNRVLPIPWSGNDVMPWPGEHPAPTAVPRRAPAWRDARRHPSPAGTPPDRRPRVKVARIQEATKRFRR